MLVTNPLARPSWARETVNAVSSGWWVLLVDGLISAVAGGLILVIDWTVSDLATFVGALFIVRGIFTMMSVPLDGSHRASTFIVGLLSVGVGIGVWVWPGPTLLVIAVWIGWWVLFSGVMTIAGSIAARDIIPYWGLVLALGIVETVFSFVLLSEPGLTLVATVLAIGLWSLIYGVVQIALAIELKRLPGRIDDARGDYAMAMSDSRAHASPAR